MRRMSGGVIPPTIDELKDIAKKYHFSLDDEQAGWFLGLIEGSLPAYQRVGQIPDETLPVKYPRTPGYRPDESDNPYNAWQRKCSIKGAESGKLAGKKVAVKDPTSVAGVPTSAGSAVVESFVPDIDATVVTRILDAGAEITGKATCEDMCISGGSVGSIPLPVKNPITLEHSAGGSSSGSAALVCAGEVDMALGADQGGSIRLPASQCGVVGLKATYGLVPYTGIFPIENSLDHVGPITKNVEDCALLLEVIAGRDGELDPRQKGEIKTAEYTKALTGDAKGLKVGILQEGFGWGDLMFVGDDEATTTMRKECKETDEAVMSAAQQFEKIGAAVSKISMPMHLDGPSIYTPIFIEGIARQMFDGNGFLLGHKGYYPTSAAMAYGRARKAEGDNFSDLSKLIMLMGEYMYEKYQGRYYYKAQNQALRLSREYDKALEEVDVLLMPTMAPYGKAMKLTHPHTVESYITETFNYHINTCIHDATGHPAISIPCGLVDGLPVGMMLVGKKFDESTVLRAAHAFEQTGTYKAPALAKV